MADIEVVRSRTEIGDIVRDHGEAFKRTRRLSLAQLKALSAIERCRTAELGGHVLACTDCAEVQIADIAYQNPALVYDLLFKVTAQTLRTIAGDPKHLGAEIGFTAVLHTWGSAMTHHPHLHCIVPGGGLDPDGQWQPCKRGFFLPVRVLSRLFRRLFLEQLTAMHNRLKFYGQLAPLTQTKVFNQHLTPTRQTDWVVYAKRSFSGPEAVLAYLSQYTHRVAISNRRLIAYDQDTVTFRWKDYRAKGNKRHSTMKLATHEFIRRFLIHILPQGFHRIRHFGLFANHQRKRKLQIVRGLLDVFDASTELVEVKPKPPTFVCRTCGIPLMIIQILNRPQRSRVFIPEPLKMAKPFNNHDSIASLYDLYVNVDFDVPFLSKKHRR